MKKITLIIVFLIAINPMKVQSEGKNFLEDFKDTIKNESRDIQDSYAENVHMYICIEALKLLKDRYPQTNFSQIENRIGTMNDCGTRAWQVGKITTGACREDLEDVVFDIRGPFGFYASNSHFWHADDRTNGDHSLTTLNILGFNTDFPNAYTKICRYLDGQWFAWSNGGYHERRYIEYLHTNGNTYRFSYHTRGLINFYKTKKIWFHSYTNTLGQETTVDEEITLDDEKFNRIIWEALGRMSHLITDMSVPAHTHSDVHVRGWDGGDCYHNWIDDGAYLNYNWLTAKNAGGVINPYEIGDDPLRYLMYSTNQLADHYPSGPDCFEIPQQHFGDNNLPGGTYPIIDQYYQQLGPPPQNIPNVYMEGAYCFNHAIRATAGLLYWFAVETGIISPDPGAYPVIHGFSKNLPDQTIYRGETLNLTCNASGSNLNFNWFQDVCHLNNWCTIPINGLAINRSDRVYSVTNVNFQNRWTCTFYDSLCNNNSLLKNYLPAEDPLHFYIGVKASNQFGQVTKYFNMNNLLNFSPVNGIRPPDPPITGCPILFTLNTNGFRCENNILHESPNPPNEGKDIEDKIVIGNTPFLDTVDNTVQFAITESGPDYNYFDKFSLLKVAHPEELTLSVTVNNDLVLINLKNAVSPKKAEKNGEDITSELKLDSSFTKNLNGKEKEIIYAQFANEINSDREKLISEIRKAKLNNAFNRSEIKDSVTIILDPSAPDVIPHPYAKREAGIIYTTDTAGITSSAGINFTKRQRRSLCVIPFLQNNEIASAELILKEDFNLSFLAVVRAFYDGFITTELELSEAENFYFEDITKTLNKSDNVYAELDSGSYIILNFIDTDEQLPKGWVYDYVLVAEGRSVEPEDYTESNMQESLNAESEQKNDSRVFTLEQNSPNPFNPKTEIKYATPAAGLVSLIIYDMLGKEISVIVNQYQKAGSYSVNFDGSDLPSGVYFYKLKAGGKVDIKRMILIK